MKTSSKCRKDCWSKGQTKREKDWRIVSKQKWKIWNCDTRPKSKSWKISLSQCQAEANYPTLSGSKNYERRRQNINNLWNNSISVISSSSRRKKPFMKRRYHNSKRKLKKIWKTRRKHSKLKSKNNWKICKKN